MRYVYIYSDAETKRGRIARENKLPLCLNIRECGALMKDRTLRYFGREIGRPDKIAPVTKGRNNEKSGAR